MLKKIFIAASALQEKASTRALLLILILVATISFSQAPSPSFPFPSFPMSSTLVHASSPENENGPKAQDTPRSPEESSKIRSKKMANPSPVPIENPIQFSATIHPNTLEATQERLSGAGNGQTPTEPRPLYAPPESPLPLLKIQIKVLPKYKAYVDQLKISIISPSGIELLDPAGSIYPQIEFLDPVKQKIKVGIANQATWELPIGVQQQLKSGDYRLVAEITSQACTDTFCLLPKKSTIQASFQVQNPNTSASETRSLFPIFTNLFSFDFQKTDLNQAFAMGLGWTFLFVFFAGVLTSLTPCIFPMIPITLTILGREAHLRSKRKQILVSHIYILGIATVYSALGVLAASTGALFGSFMSHPIVLGFISAIFLGMALSMFGLFELQPPKALSQRIHRIQIYGPAGVFVQGLFAGILASPCVGPVLVGILTYIAKTQNLWLGFWLMFVFALGMGQLFLVFGMGVQASKWLPKTGAWMENIKVFFGFLILIPFFYYLQLLVPKVAFLAILSATLIMLAYYSLKKWRSVWLPLILLLGAANTINRLGPQVLNQTFSGTFLGLTFLGTPSEWAFSQIFLRMLGQSGEGLDSQAIRSDQNQVGRGNLPPLLSDPSRSTHAPSPLTRTNSQELKTDFKPFNQLELESALAKGVPIIIDFWADWCAACIQLEEKTFTNLEFRKLTQNFLLLKFDATSDSPEFKELKLKYDIVGLPTVIMIDSKGRWRRDLTIHEYIPPESAIKLIQNLQ